MSPKPHNLPPQCKYDHGGPFYTHDQAKAMNAAFAVRMLAARRDGLERFTLGIVIDKTPMVPTIFHPELYHSLMSSAAGACSESGIGENIPERAIPTMGTST